MFSTFPKYMKVSSNQQLSLWATASATPFHLPWDHSLSTHITTYILSVHICLLTKRLLTHKTNYFIGTHSPLHLTTFHPAFHQNILTATTRFQIVHNSLFFEHVMLSEFHLGNTSFPSLKLTLTTKINNELFSTVFMPTPLMDLVGPTNQNQLLV